MNNIVERINTNERLVWRGRNINTTFMVEVENDAYLVSISRGRIASVRHGPFIQPSWSFAMRAPRSSWCKFWQTVPPPCFNDLLALVKHGGLRIEGNMQVFMTNLIYFKGVMAELRLEETQP